MMKYSIFKTLFGWMGVVEGEKGLKRIILPHSRRTEVKKIIFQEFPGVKEDSAYLKPFTDILVRYCKGEKFTQCFSYDTADYTKFLVTVWETTQAIPWGEVRSYQWLSAQIKNPRAFRAIGNALGKNPFPIIVPCHRVIRSDGSLGGFSAPRGILLKQRLLQLEGVLFDSKGRVIDFKKKEQNRERRLR